MGQPCIVFIWQGFGDTGAAGARAGLSHGPTEAGCLQRAGHASTLGALLPRTEPARCLLPTFSKSFSFLLIAEPEIIPPCHNANVYKGLHALFSGLWPQRSRILHSLYKRGPRSPLPSHQPPRQIAPSQPCRRRYPQFFKHCLSRALRWKAKAASCLNSSGETAAYQPITAMIWDLFTVWAIDKQNNL